jgi:hypothetical protein
LERIDFDRAPVDVISLALEYSRQVAPDSPIHEIVERIIPGRVGALVYGEARPRQWAIMYHVGQSEGRRSFTVGHEFGHYVAPPVDRGGRAFRRRYPLRRECSGSSGIEQKPMSSPQRC